MIIITIIQLLNAIFIPCVDYNKDCYYQPCCEPYICYEETVCIGMDNITKI